MDTSSLPKRAGGLGRAAWAIGGAGAAVAGAVTAVGETIASTAVQAGSASANASSRRGDSRRSTSSSRASMWTTWWAALILTSATALDGFRRDRIGDELKAAFHALMKERAETVEDSGGSSMQ